MKARLPPRSFRVDLSANTVTHDRMVSAVEAATEPGQLFLPTGAGGTGLQRVRAVLSCVAGTASRAAAYDQSVWDNRYAGWREVLAG
jgi:hypothetical protein